MEEKDPVVGYLVQSKHQESSYAPWEYVRFFTDKEKAITTYDNRVRNEPNMYHVVIPLSSDGDAIEDILPIRSN